MINALGGRKNTNGLVGSIMVFVMVLLVTILVAIRGELPQQVIDLVKWGAGSIAILLGITNYSLAKSDEANGGKNVK